MNKKSQYFHDDDWYQNQLQQRTREAIAQKQEAFAQEHGQDTDEQLLDYVRSFREKHGYTPNAEEIIGGPYIVERFHDWDAVVAAAGLPEPGEILSLEKRYIYKKELKRQEKLLRQANKSEKDAAREWRRQRDLEGRKADLERQEHDFAWGVDHAADTDEQLIAYLRQCTDALGHAPVSKEVLGAAYIAKRFGSWAVALTVACIPLPDGVKPPNPKTLKAYRLRVRAEAPDGSEQI